MVRGAGGERLCRRSAHHSHWITGRAHAQEQEGAFGLATATHTRDTGEMMRQLPSNPRALMSHFDSRIKLKDGNFASKALSSPLHTASTQDTSSEHSLET